MSGTSASRLDAIWDGFSGSMFRFAGGREVVMLGTGLRVPFNYSGGRVHVTIPQLISYVAVVSD